MPRIELRDLTANMNHEQILFCSWFYSMFDYNIAGINNRRIINVEPIFFQAAIAGSEFLTYAATKLYLAIETVNSSNFASSTGSDVRIYNEANALVVYHTIPANYWDATAAALRTTGSNIFLKNYYFSRLVVTNYPSFTFNGYRITLG